MSLTIAPLAPYLALPSSAYGAELPKILSYQGRLTDSAGNLLGGSGTTYYFKFSLWNTAATSSGSRVWPTTAPSAVTNSVRQGVFTVNIGDTASGYPDALDYPFDSTNVYLQVEVSSNGTTYETLSPRQQISSTAFAQVSAAVRGAGQSAIGTTTPDSAAVLTIEATTSTATPLAIRGAPGQSADLFTVRNSVGTSLFSINSLGALTLGNATGILFSNSGAVSALANGSDGQVLKMIAGIPTWGLDIASSGGSGTWATTTDSLALYPSDIAQTVLVGSSATSTAGNILEVSGNSLFRGTITAYRLLTAPYFTATSTTASVFPYASTTAITATNASTSNLTISNASGGILKTTATGLVTLAVSGIDYVSSVTGDWSGTFDGLEGAAYLANSFSTTSADYLASQRNFFSTSSADYLASQRNSFSTTSNDFFVSERNFFSTTSTNYWKSITDFFSTSSAQYLFTVSNFFSTSSEDYYRGQNNFFSTTSASYFLAQNQGAAFSTTSANYLLTTYEKGFFFSTTSVDYWKLANSFFSTTSVDYWKSATNFFSTTSADYLASQRNFFSTTSASFFADSSTTIPKTYSNNTFSGSNAFTGGLTVGILSGPLQANAGLISATTSIGVLYGGTGLSIYAPGDLLYANTPTSFARIASSTSGMVLALVNGIPTWSATTTLATISGTINLQTQTAGILPVANGGTGWNTIAAGTMLYGNGSSALATTSAGTSGYVLAYLNGIPTWTATTTFSNGLTYANGNVTLDTSGNWSGTLQGYSASQLIALGFSSTSANYFLSVNQNAAFSTTSANYLLTTYDKGFFFSTTSIDALTEQRNFFSTSSASYFLAQNQGSAFSTTSTDYLFTTYDKGLFFSTTSIDYWKLANTFFSTTSADYWKSATNFFSTTSADYLASQRSFFSTTSATYFADASTTIPKTYSDNAFSGNNTFAQTITGSVSGNAGTVTNGVYTTTFNGLFDPRFITDLAATTSVNSISTLSNLSIAKSQVSDFGTYESPLTFSYPLVRSLNSISSAFGTTTSNTYAGTQNFTNPIVLSTLSGLIGANNGTTYAVSTSTLSIGGNAETATTLQTSRNINNVAFNGSADIIITAASSSLLTDSNLFTGNNIFSQTITGSVSGNAGTVTNGVYTTSFNGLFDTRFVTNLAATTSINSIVTLANLSLPYAQLTGAPSTIGYPFALAGNATSTLTQFNGGLTALASSTIGNGSAQGGLTVNGTATTTNLVFTGLASTLLKVNAQGTVAAAIAGTDYLAVDTTLFSTTSADYWKSATNFFSTTSADYLASQSNFFSTTSTDYYVSQNNFFSTTSADYLATQRSFFSTTSTSYFLAENQSAAFSSTSASYLLTALDKGFFFSTTSSDYWKLANNFFSTTSTDYWKSATNFFSTSSADYLASQRNFFSTTSADFFITQRDFFSTTSVNYWKNITDLFSTTSVNYFAGSSTTIPKTYTSNTFAGTQTFLNASTTNISAAYASTTVLVAGTFSLGNGTGVLYATGGAVNSLANGSDGSVLKISAGVPTWGIDNSGSGGSAILATTTDSLAAYFSPSSIVLLLGQNATTTAGNIFEANGNSLFRGSVTAYRTISAPAFIATSSIASILPYASTTAITATNASTSELTISGAAGGLLKTDSRGFVSLASPGVDYINSTSGDWTGTLNGYSASQLIGLGFSTTSANYFLSLNQGAAFSTTSANCLLTTYDKGFFFSTTSTDYWKTANDFFSTTSTDYWKSATNFFSTTSADYLASQRNFFSTTSASYFVDSSTTLPKTYTANTFTGSNVFSQTITGSVSGNAGTASALQSARTINGVSFDGTGNIIITAASSTLLTDSNLFSGNNTFSQTITGSITGNAGTVTNGVYTTTFNSLFDPRFITDLAATTSISSIITLANLSLPYSQLTGTPGIPGYSFALSGNATSTLTQFNSGLTSYASTTIGNGTATGGLTINGTATTTNLVFTGLGNALLSTDSQGRVVGTSTLTTSYLNGNLGTINGTNFNAGGSITITSASSTLLANNNTFSGANIFAQTIAGSVSGNAGTATALQNARIINGVSFDGTSDILITAASSTLLGDANTFTGASTFAQTISGSVSGNAGTVTNGVYTTTFNGLFDPRFITSLAATSSISSIVTLANLSLPYSQLTGTPGIAGYPFALAGNATSTLTQFNGGLTAFASSTIGNGTATGGLTVNGTATTTNLVFTGLASTLLKVNGQGQVAAAISGTDYLAGNTTLFSTTSADFWESQRSFFSTSSTDYYVAQNNFFSTTSTDYFASQRNFFSTTSAAYILTTYDKGFFFSTTSSDYWKLANNFFSTTSADYWKSATNFFSTTSADYLATQRNFFSTTSASYFADSSTTIPKTYTANIFSGANTFSQTITGSINGNAGTATALQNARTINGVSFNGTANITITAASSTLLADSNLFSGNNTFSQTITGSVNGNAGTVTNGVYTTTFNGLFDPRFITNLAGTTSINSIVTLNNLSLPYSQLTGTPSIPGYPFALSGNATSTLTQFNGGLTAYASSTIGNGTTQSGLTVNGTATTTNLIFTNLASAILATDLQGKVVATTSIGSNNISGSLGTINGTNFNAGSSITVTAASSTLLANSNAWTGLNQFSNATTTLLSGTTAWFSNFIGNLAGNASTATALQNARTINGVSFNGTGDITITAASSSLLSDNNTFAGANTFLQTITGSISGNAGTLGGYSASELIGLGFSTTSADYLASQRNYFSTTSADYFVSERNSFSTTSANYLLTTYNKGFFFSTTSTDYWKTANNFFSTTSSNFWASGVNFFSTTSADYLASQRNFFSTSSASYFVDSSTTIPKTYTNNTFLGTQTFNSASTTALTAVTASTTNLYVSSAPSTLLKTDAAGKVVPAIAGSDYLTSATTFGYLFPNNATTSLLTFTNGLLAYGSTTIGNGTTQGGLTINGTATTTNLIFTGLGSALLATDVNGKVIATTSIGTSILSGALGTINGTTLNSGSSITITAASSTLLANNNTFSGADVFTQTITGSISGNAGTATALQNARTINGVSFDGTGDITIAAASSTLLGNNNTFSGNNTFSQTIAGSITGSAGTVTNGVYTTTFNSLFDPRFITSLTATSSINSIVTLNNLSLPYSQLTGTPSIAGYPFALTGNATSTLTQLNGGLTAFASSTIGNGTATGGLTVNGTATTSNLVFTSLGNALLSTDANGKVIATSTLATSYLSGTLATINTTPITAGGTFTITAASSTLLANNNTFSGANTFSQTITGDITGNAGSLNGYTASQLIGLGFSTTSANYFLSLNQGAAFSTTSANYLLTTVDKGFFFSTTSTDYWKLANNFFSTTSADYWKSATNFFSTTSADYLASQRNFFSTTSASYFVDASTTIPKTYSNNTFSGANTFSQTVTGSISGNAGTATALQNSRTINGVSFDGTGNITLFAASSSLFADNNLFAGANTFSQTIAGSISGNAGTVTNGVYTTTFNGLFDPRFITQLAATTSINSIITLSNLSLPYSQLTGTPGISGYPFALTGNATSTLTQFNGGLTSYGSTTIGNGTATGGLTVNGTATTSNLIFTGLGSALLSTDAQGKVVATSTLATTYLSGSLGTINNTTFNAGSSITITAASSTLLGDVNTFTGANTFSQTITGSVSGNAGTVTNGVYTTTFNSLFDPRFITQLAATTSINSIVTLNNLSLPYSQLTGTPGIAGYPFALAGNATSTLTQFNGGLTGYASSTIGNGAQGGGLTINGGATTTGNAYFSGNVGIGTSSPTRKLEIYDPAAAVVRISRGANTGYASVDYLPTGGLSASNVIWGSGLFPNSNNFSIWNNNGSVDARIFDITNTGNIGIGTTTPGSALSVQGNQFIAGNIVSTSTTASIFPYASSTALTAGNLFATNATTTSLAITSISSGSLVKTTTGGALTAAVAGSDYLIGANLVNPFPSSATSTLLNFNGGLTAFASSTIGNGTATGGLTVNGTATTSNLIFTGLGSALLSTDAQGKVVSTSTLTTSYLNGSLGTVNGTTFNAGNSITITAASSTLLTNSNSWTGLNQFSNATTTLLSGSTAWFTTFVGNLTGDVTGNVSGNAGTATALQNARTINGVSFDGTGNITITAASSSLLGDVNTFTGANAFSQTITGSISGNAGTVTNGVYTTTFNSLFDPRFITNLAGTTSINSIVTLNNLSLPYSQLTGTPSIPGYPFALSGNATSTLTQFNGGLTAFASSTVGDGTATGGLTINGTATTTNLIFTGLASTLLKVNGQGQVAAAVSGTDYAAFSYPFIGNATTTQIAFNGGLTATTIVATQATTTSQYSNLYTGNSAVFGATASSTFTASGALGIATTSPAGSLSIQVNSTSGSIMEISNTSSSNWTGGANGGFLVLRSGASGTTGGNYIINYIASGTSIPRFYVDSGGRVGAPNGAANAPSYTFTGDTNNGLYAPTADVLGFTTNGLERLRIDSAGNVGIGTTTPGSALSIQGNQFIAGNIVSTSTTASTFPYASTTAISGTNLQFTNATTTSLFANIASTSLLFASGLGCPAGQYITWTGGSFGCATDQTSAGAAPFTWLNTFSTSTIATTSSIITQGVFFSSSTAAASQFPYASSTALTAGNLFSTNATTTSLGLSNIFSAAALAVKAADVAGGAGSAISISAGNNTSGSANGGALTLTTGSSINLNGGDLNLVTGGGGDLGSFGAINFKQGSNLRGGFSNQGDFSIGTSNLFVGSAANPLTNGFVGIGTSSPYVRLSVSGAGVFDGNVRASYFLATSTTASTFPYASTTAITSSVASTSLLFANGLGCPAGQYITWTSGSFGCSPDLTSSFAYPFSLTSNATSTLTQFNGGLTSYASTTIGNGTATGGLTVNGTATTTNLVFTGLGSALLSTDASGKVVATTSIGTNLLSGTLATINTTAITAGGTFTITAASSTLLANNNTFSGNNTFSQTITGSISGNAGTVTNGVYTTTFNSLFDPRFITQLVATSSISSIVTLANLSLPYSQLTGTPGIAGYPFALAGNATSTLTQFNGGLTAFASSTVGNGTATGGLTINGTATTTNLIFTGLSNGLLKVNGQGQVAAAISGTDYAAFAYSFVGNATTTLLNFNGGLTFTNATGTNLFANYLTANSTAFGATGTTTITSSGFLGVGTSSPWGLLSVNANGLTGQAPQFVVGSSSATKFIVTNGGNVGIGTSSPGAAFSIASANAYFAGNVGIGIAAPAYNFQSHNGTGQSNIAVTTDVNLGSGNTTQLTFVSDLDGTPSSASIGQFNTGDLRFSGIGNLVSPDMVLSTAGFLGIGTASPTGKLSIVSAPSGTTDAPGFSLLDTHALSSITTTGIVAVSAASTTYNPSATLTNGASGLNSVTTNGFTKNLDLSGITLGAISVSGARNSFIANGDTVSITGSPVINDSNSTGLAQQLTVLGTNSTVNVTPTLTSLTNTSSFTSIAGSFQNTSSAGGNAFLASKAYGIQVTSSGSLTTTRGDEVHYGGHFTVDGSAVNNYGLYLSSVSGATNNYGLYIDAVAAAATNYALYSAATAQSYFAGNVGIGSTTPFAKLSVKGAGTGGGINFQTTDSNDNPVFTVDDAGDATATGILGASGLQVSSNGGIAMEVTGGDVQITSPGIITLAGTFNQLVGNASFGANVGIGTSSTYTKLAVSSASQQDGNLPLFEVASTTNASLLRVLGNGNVGIGTTTPYRQLSVGSSAVFGGDILAAYFIATSTARASTFPYASSTALTAGNLFSTTANLGNATSTSLAITSITSGSLLKTTTGGALVAAVAGTDYLTSATTFGYLFPSNSTSTLLNFNGGLTAAGATTTALAVTGSTTISSVLNVSGNAPSFINFASSTALTAGNLFANNITSTGSFIFGSATGTNLFAGGTLSASGALFGATGTTTITSAGFLGVGTSSPSSILSVSGVANFITNATSSIYGALATQNLIPAGPYTNNLAGYDLGATGTRWNALWAGTVNIGTSTFSLKADANSSLGIYTAASGGGTQALTVTQSGNVGIGTTTPASILDVTSNTNGLGRVYFNNISSGASRREDLAIRTNGSNSEAIFLGVDQGNAFSLGTTIKSYLDNRSGGSFSFLNNGSHAMTIDTSGNVGIGTTSPGRLLEISAASTNTTVNNASTAAFGIVNTNTTVNNTADISFRTNDANGAQASGAKIVGVFTSHTASAVSGDLAFVTTSAGTGSEKLRITSGGLVGIGTTTPNAQLTIQSTNSGTASPALNFTSAGTQFLGISRIAATAGAALQTFAGANLVLQPDSGNVGIGSSTPNTPLTIYDGNTHNNGTLFNQLTLSTAMNIPSGGAGSGNLINFVGFNDVKVAALGGYSPATNVYGLGFWAAGNTGSPQMMLNNSGNLGIGQSTPSFRLDVTSANATTSSFVTTLADTAASNWPAAALIGNANAANYPAEGNSFNKLVRASVAGMGTFNHISADTTHMIAGIYGWVPVGGHGGGAAAGLFDRPDSNVWVSLSGGHGNGTTIQAIEVYDYNAAAQKFVVSTGGTLSCSSGCTNGISDERLKTNIETLHADSGLSAIEQLNPVSFNWRSTDMSSSTQYGFIAQDVEKVLPELVLSMGTSSIRNPDGSFQSFGNTKGLNITGFIPVAVKAIQELDLDLKSIASTSATSTPQSQSFADSFFKNLFGRITAWFASAANGIGDLYASIIHSKEVHTKEICVEKSDGSEVCVTGDQLAAVLAAQNSPPPPTPTPPPPPPAETIDPTATSTPDVVLSGGNDTVSDTNSSIVADTASSTTP